MILHDVNKGFRKPFLAKAGKAFSDAPLQLYIDYRAYTPSRPPLLLIPSLLIHNSLPCHNTYAYRLSHSLATIRIAFSDRGVMLHENALGRLPKDDQDIKASFHSTYLVSPVSNTISGVISFPSSSLALLTFTVANMVATAIHILAAARCLPGHILWVHEKLGAAFGLYETITSDRTRTWLRGEALRFLPVTRARNGRG